MLPLSLRISMLAMAAVMAAMISEAPAGTDNGGVPQVKIWLPETSGLFHDPTRWSPFGIPQIIDTAVFPNPSTVFFNADAFSHAAMANFTPVAELLIWSSGGDYAYTIGSLLSVPYLRRLEIEDLAISVPGLISISGGEVHAMGSGDWQVGTLIVTPTVVGENTPFSGSLTLGAPGSTYIFGAGFLGVESSLLGASLNIVNGSSATFETLEIGDSSDASVTVDVCSSLTIGEGGLAIGAPQVEATLHVEQSATATANGPVTISALDLIEVRGGAFHLNADLFSFGTVATFDGGVVNVGSGVTMEFAGGGSFAHDGGFGLGAAGGSTLQLHPGTEASSVASWRIGPEPGESGSVQLNGVDQNGERATLSGTGAASDLIVGDEGTGWLWVLEGSEASFGDDVIIGRDTGSTGITVVSGVSSGGFRSRILIDRNGSGSWLFIGDEGEGSLTVTNGGEVAVEGNLRLARFSGARGEVMILGSTQGHDAELVVDGSTHLGSINPDTAGTIIIDDGGSFVAGEIYSGSEMEVMSGGTASSNASATIWTGGTMTVKGLMQLAEQLVNHGELRGGGTIAGEGSIQNTGAISPGINNGSLTVPDCDLSTGTLMIEIFGPSPVQYDRLVSTGDVDLGGTLELHFGGYEPPAGTTFTIIQASGVTGDFDDIQVIGGDFGVMVTDSAGQVVVHVIDTIPGPAPGDVDGNGVVDVEDLVAVIVAWGDCDGCPADLDGDGVVNVDDLVAVILGWT